MQIHIAKDGHRMGPFPIEEVNRQLAAGSIGLSDLAWYEGIPAWIPLSQVPGILPPGAGAAMAPLGTASTFGATDIAETAGYAGFWIRAAAYLIDLMIIGVLLLPVRLIGGMGAQSQSSPTLGIVSLCITFFYWTVLWSSTFQGTLAQKLFGLRIVNATNGGRISFLQAVGRWFALLLAFAIAFVGVIMVAFTSRKQGLHDMIANTCVLKG